MNYQWKIRDHKIAFQGYFQIQEFTLEHEKYEGGWTAKFTREIFERGSAVAVVPYDPVNDTVVLIEQFRAGCLGTQERPWLKEIVAGIIEEGESQQEVAERETMEEAGCRIEALEKITQYYVSPGGTTEQCALYCAKINSTGVGGVFGLEHEQEDILVEVVSLDQAAQWVQRGIINSAASIIAIQWLVMNRDDLRARWI